MKIEREVLEREAVDCVSVDLYYQLLDEIESMSDQELVDLIESKNVYQ